MGKGLMKKEYVHIYLDPIVDNLLTVIKDYTGKPKTRIVSDAIAYYAYEEALKQGEEGRFMILTAADKTVNYLNHSVAIARRAMRKSGLENGSKNLRRYVISSNKKRNIIRHIVKEQEKEKQTLENKRKELTNKGE